MTVTVSPTLNLTVGELAANNPAAIRIFERYGIDYCCRGFVEVSEACRTAGVTFAEFQSALGEAVAAPEFGTDWSEHSLTELNDYLVSRFHVHAREELDTMMMLATKVAGVHAARHPETIKVAQLVAALQNDMLPHMMKEEMILFPYVAGLESGEAGSSCFGTVANPIRVMMMDHEAVGDLLVQLRETTSGYAPPEDACFSYGELYRRLAAFEKETHEHIHLENNVHFPRALMLEQNQ
jgi:regulator of cell morphogenesis and NO signaling